jgi:hypothetical protein
MPSASTGYSTAALMVGSGDDGRSQLRRPSSSDSVMSVGTRSPRTELRGCIANAAEYPSPTWCPSPMRVLSHLLIKCVGNDWLLPTVAEAASRFARPTGHGMLGGKDAQGTGLPQHPLRAFSRMGAVFAHFQDFSLGHPCECLLSFARMDCPVTSIHERFIACGLNLIDSLRSLHCHEPRLVLFPGSAKPFVLDGIVGAENRHVVVLRQAIWVTKLNSAAIGCSFRTPRSRVLPRRSRRRRP